MTRMSGWKRAAVVGAAVGAAVLGLSGCAAGGGTSADGIRVVASTNAWGSVAEAIGGDLVQVTSLIHDANQDPHDFQSSAQDLKSVANAQLLIENGGGYDDFMDQLIATAGGTAPLLNAVDLSGIEQGADFNEHVWYSLPTAGKVAAEIADQLSLLDPANAENYSTNLAAFQQGLTELSQTLAASQGRAVKTDVLVTEPVPLYLIADAGLTDVTPSAFSDAIEAGNDAPPSAVQQMLQLLAAKGVLFLALNPQTGGEQTDEMIAAAEDAGVPVLTFTETLPQGKDYLSWMRVNVSAIANAVAH